MEYFHAFQTAPNLLTFCKVIIHHAYFTLILILTLSIGLQIIQVLVGS